MLIKEFKKRKSDLLNSLDKLKEYKFVPLKFQDYNLSVDDVDNQKKELNDERFYISVCGQIKSGKSTFLNNWLFDGKKILATDDSICTANLTEIKYGKKEQAKIHFYTLKEWKKIKNKKIELDGIKDSLKAKTKKILEKEQNTYFNSFLKLKLTKIANEGIYDRNFINKHRKVIILNDIKKISEYSSKDGKYSIFVKKIELFLNNENLKNVIVVDTPGLNDPNIEREKITKNFIKRSSAIIYLMYIGQTFSKEDLNFIDKHLSIIPSNKILFAISKCDLDDFDEVKYYAEKQIKNNKKLKDRHLLENGKIYPISVMASIIKKKQNKNIALNEDEQNLLDNASAIDECIENNGYLTKFYQAISEKLMQDKGIAVIEKAKRFITDTCDKKINILTLQIDLKRIKLNNINTTLKERESKIKDIKTIRKEVRKLRDQYQKINKKLNEELMNKITENVSKLTDNIDSKYSDWIESKDLDKIIKLTTSKLRKWFKDGLIKKNEKFINNDIFEQLKKNIEDHRKEIKSEVKKITDLEFTYILKPTLDIAKFITLTEEIIDDKLNPDFFEKNRERVWGFLWTKSNAMKVNIKASVKNTINGIEKDIRNNLRPSIKKKIWEIIEENDKIVKYLLKHILKEIEDIKSDDSFKDKNVIKNKIKTIQKKLANFQKQKAKIVSEF